MSLPIVNQEMWSTLEPALNNYSLKTKMLAYSVLVEGQAVSKVARDNDLSRQTVYEAVWRFATALENHQATKLVPVYVWLPEDVAKEVRAMSEKYISDLKK